MKNNYRKLKLSILLQTVFVTALTLLVGGVILKYFLEDSSNELVDMLTSIHVSEEDAIQWYWKVLGNNKEFILVMGFLCLFSILTIKPACFGRFLGVDSVRKARFCII